MARVTIAELKTELEELRGLYRQAAAARDEFSRKLKEQSEESQHLKVQLHDVTMKLERRKGYIDRVREVERGMKDETDICHEFGPDLPIHRYR